MVGQFIFLESYENLKTYEELEPMHNLQCYQ